MASSGRERMHTRPLAHAFFCFTGSKYSTSNKKSLGPIRKGKAQLNYFNYSSLRSFRRSAQQMLQSPSSLLLQGLQTFKSQAHSSLAAGTHEAPFRFSSFLYLCASSVCGAHILSIHLEMATRYNLRQRPVLNPARVTADTWGP